MARGWPAAMPTVVNHRCIALSTARSAASSATASISARDVMPGPTVAVTRHGASSGALQLGPLPILQNRRSTNNSQHYQQPRPPPLVAAVLAVDVSDWSCEREVPAVEADRKSTRLNSSH